MGKAARSASKHYRRKLKERSTTPNSVSPNAKDYRAALESKVHYKSVSHVTRQEGHSRQFYVETSIMKNDSRT